jgi:hypothetical protein
MTSFFYVVSIAFHTSVTALRKCMDTSRKKNSFGWERSQSCTACCTSSSDLMPFRNFLVHYYTCCHDRHASPYWTFICRWISMDFTPYLLTPWNRVSLEKLTGLQLVNKFPWFYGTRRFLTAITSARHVSLSWASPIQSPHPLPTSWRSILTLSSHLRLGFPSGLFPSGFIP